MNTNLLTTKPNIVDPTPTLMTLLGVRTPEAWLEQATTEHTILLIDHANCEKKAASTALNLLYRYIDRSELLHKLSQLAREELLHFEQVLHIMEQRHMTYTALTASRYAGKLHQAIRPEEPHRLVDTLIIGAFIEARSCERFYQLIPYVDTELGKFYQYLLKSEQRHFEDYLALAKSYTKEPIDSRIQFFRNLEAELILTPDPQFRFHSGTPQ